MPYNPRMPYNPIMPYTPIDRGYKPKGRRDRDYDYLYNYSYQPQAAPIFYKPSVSYSSPVSYGNIGSAYLAPMSYESGRSDYNLYSSRYELI